MYVYIHTHKYMYTHIHTLLCIPYYVLGNIIISYTFAKKSNCRILVHLTIIEIIAMLIKYRMYLKLFLNNSSCYIKI